MITFIFFISVIFRNAASGKGGKSFRKRIKASFRRKSTREKKTSTAAAAPTTSSSTLQPPPPTDFYHPPPSPSAINNPADQTSRTSSRSPSPAQAVGGGVITAQEEQEITQVLALARKPTIKFNRRLRTMLAASDTETESLDAVPTA